MIGSTQTRRRPSRAALRLRPEERDPKVASLHTQFINVVSKMGRLPAGPEMVLNLLVEAMGQVGNEAGGHVLIGAPELAARKAGVTRRMDLLNEHGGMCSAEQAARKLDLSKPAVLDRAEKGQVLGLRVLKQNAVRFPLFQFAANDEALIPGLDVVLRELKEEPALDAWAKCNFLLSPRNSMGGKSPLALLQDGQVAKVVALARSYAN